MSPKPVVSSFTALSQLETVFSLDDARLVTGLSRNAAGVALVRWKKAGKIEPVGARTALYFNLQREPAGRRKLLPRAIAQLYPSAVLIGGSVLHARGVTTQIPQEMTVAIPSPDRSLGPVRQSNTAQIEGIRLFRRPFSWFSTIAGHLGDPIYGLPALRPEMAISDMYANAAGWCPDPDDLNLEELDGSYLKSCFQGLNVDLSDRRVSEILAHVGDDLSAVRTEPLEQSCS